MNSVVALAGESSSSGMPEAIKTGLVDGITVARDYVIDGLAVVIPVAMSISAIKFGINVILSLFHSFSPRRLFL